MSDHDHYNTLRLARDVIDEKLLPEDAIYFGKRIATALIALHAENDRLRAAWAAVGEVLSDEGCDCEDEIDLLDLDERCLGHRIEAAWDSLDEAVK